MAGETEKWRKIYLIDKLLTKKYLTEVLKYLKMYNFIFERRLLTRVKGSTLKLQEREGT